MFFVFLCGFFNRFFLGGHFSRAFPKAKAPQVRELSELVKLGDGIIRGVGNVLVMGGIVVFHGVSLFFFVYSFLFNYSVSCV